MLFNVWPGQARHLICASADTTELLKLAGADGAVDTSVYSSAGDVLGNK